MDKYLKVISGMKELNENDVPSAELLHWENASKKLKCFYSPFEYINQDAEIILVGITPGKTQMNLAINSAIKSMAKRLDKDSMLYKAKLTASFSGDKTRNNLINILDRTGYQKKLGINSVSLLWEPEYNHLVHFCSLLKNPVFYNDKNFNAKPDLNIPEFRVMIDEFVKDLALINPNALLIPLGDKVSSVITILNNKNKIQQKLLMVDGKIIAPPHPSGENGESISLLLEEKYPEKDAYTKQKYKVYLDKKLKEGKKPQAEIIYKKTRHTRWESMRIVRNAYGII